MRTLLVLLAALISAAPASAITLNLMGKSAPKIVVYRQSETTAVVYDARPEMGVGLAAGKTAVGALDAVDVHIARVTIEMNVMEPTDQPGVYDSVYLDKITKLVDDCRQRGICLVVALENVPLGSASSKLGAQTDRLARFAGDMSTRYPSVAYWELGKDASRAVSAAMRAANPAANQHLHHRHSRRTPPSSLPDIYAVGPPYFDIVCAETDAKSFVDTAAAFRKAMETGGDATKPLWCLYTDGFEQQKLEAAFAANNASLLYQKVLVASTGAGGQSAWLLNARVNIGDRPAPSQHGQRHDPDQDAHDPDRL